MKENISKNYRKTLFKVCTRVDGFWHKMQFLLAFAPTSSIKIGRDIRICYYYMRESPLIIYIMHFVKNIRYTPLMIICFQKKEDEKIIHIILLTLHRISLCLSFIFLPKKTKFIKELLSFIFEKRKDRFFCAPASYK